jgi:hypothetical protein
MKSKIAAMCLVAGMAPAAMAGTVDVAIDQSDAPWLGFMNVSEINPDGTAGAFVFGSGWGVPDLVATFDDANNELTMSPNTVNDPDPFWYVGGGGPGAMGNKYMEGNLYQESTGGALGGQTVTFSGDLTSLSLTDAHKVSVFIRDFEAGFGSSVDNIVELTSAGAFSISLDTIDDPTRVVQWGIRFEGVNVWSTDVAPFGTAVFATIPTPGALAMLGLGGLVAARRRR